MSLGPFPIIDVQLANAERWGKEGLLRFFVTIAGWVRILFFMKQRIYLARLNIY